jgi:hypothetical protein
MCLLITVVLCLHDKIADSRIINQIDILYIIIDLNYNLFLNYSYSLYYKDLERHRGKQAQRHKVNKISTLCLCACSLYPYFAFVPILSTPSLCLFA